MKKNFLFETDLTAKKIRIVREFNAPIEKVWKAWTDADLLGKWLAPKPLTIVTKIMDFTVGGIWLYTMVDPDRQKPWWTRMEFTAIEDGCSFSSTGAFADEDGNTAPDGPRTYRVTKFSSIEGNRTEVDMVITFTHEATIKMFADGGFESGTAMGFNNLDELLAAN
jgi:uncharacterized protein YndB with AHSA1/START domain